ncbi:exodeoxyribonuclease V subunit alpha [Candidatus Endoriftia persephone]|uniref:RecBCD enzyme subunit RecD n=1 Tax=Candidatus Endoriftia persephonae TaxID=393765 RepID=A0A9J6ZX42_9GAMM|nr:exodeoxyribonuclease V subunit alpha [Candidatus Endoriftia persephone]USF87223.1 exodeoxyribonuclease V subunit alpha [Candidatus Endoriftia persephone]
MSGTGMREALAAGSLRELDLYFAERLTANLQQGRELVAIAAALVSHAVGEGDVCVDLAKHAEQRLFVTEGFSGVAAPPLADWLQQLADSPLVGGPGQSQALILDEQRLYLGRYWRFEADLADRLRQLATVPLEAVDRVLLRGGLQRLFPDCDDEIDWQRVAAAMALLRRLLVISGGPGTGKTHTVAAILALLIEQAQAQGQRPLRIALAAPTGKAAARLTESIRKLRAGLNLSEAVREAIPAEALTLHRLIGVRPGRAQPRYTAENPLHLDLLVVDEASMIDLPLMNRVVAALPGQARLILLGDKDQLASVEAGSVFADLCGRGGELLLSEAMREALAQVGVGQLPGAGSTEPMADSIALLRKSYRFDRQSGIGELAGAINGGDTARLRAVLASASAELRWRELAESERNRPLAEFALQAFAPVMQAAGPEAALDALDRVRILCALRQGAAGVEQVNRQVAQALQVAGLIRREEEHYAGRPIMISRNDYHLGLFNGDVGLLWPDAAAGGVLRAWFRLPDNSLRRVLPARLPPHETAFALTVHKSQGSEFARVLLLLPDSDSLVLSRELLYTGVTRASGTVELWGRWEILAAAVGRRLSRASGLSERLRLPG